MAPTVSFFDTKSPSFAYLCCLLVILLDVLKRTPTSIPRRRLDLLLNATWYEFVYYPNLVFCQLFIIFIPQVFGEACESLPGEEQKIPHTLLWSDG